jgi:hypothetical protein
MGMTAKELAALFAALPPDQTVPTMQMIDAGNDGIDSAIDSWNYDSDQGYCVEPHAAKECWDRMIAALRS